MSKTTLPYVVLDVFTNEAFTGNQLGVVLLDETTSGNTTQAQKHAITKEFKYSETIFVHPYDKTTSTRRVDIWTPKTEIPFAGHPTIGAVHHVIRNMSPERDGNDNKCVLQLKAGQVVGYLDPSTNHARAEIPQDVRVNAVPLGWDRVITSQPGLAKGQVGAKVTQTQHRAVSIVKGMTFVLVDLSLQPDLLTRVEIAHQNVAEIADLDAGWNVGLMGTLFFVKKPDRGDGVQRVDQRVIVIGLEDPATGSASSALAAFLALQNPSKGTVQKFELEQGTQMGRRSIIRCEVTLNALGTGVDRIMLSGQVAQTMKGELCF